MKQNTSKYRKMMNALLGFLVIVPACLIMTFADITLAKRSEAVHKKMKLEILEKIVSDAEHRSAQKQSVYDERVRRDTELNSASLRQILAAEETLAEKRFRHGFVAELQGDRVILPEDLPSGKMYISRELIETSLERGAVRTGVYIMDAGASGLSLVSKEDPDIDAMFRTLSEDGEEAAAFYLSFGRISDSLIYVGMTSRTDDIDSIFRESPESFRMLETAGETFGSITLIAAEENGSLKLVRSFGSTGDKTDLSEYGLSEDAVRMETPQASLGKETYDCYYNVYKNGWAGEDVYAIFMIPQSLPQYRNRFGILAVCSLIFLVFGAMIVYAEAVKNYVRNTVLTEEQAQKYTPQKIRQRLLMAGVLGGVTVVALASLTHGAGLIRAELKQGRDVLHILTAYYENEQMNPGSSAEEEEKKWVIRYGEEIAELLPDHPVLAARENLQAYCDLLNIDYIMLFDANGDETLCSGDYSGFTLQMSSRNGGPDFTRLLLGVKSIVQYPAKDAVTGEERMITGVTMKDSSEAEKHGALVMSLVPEANDEKTLAEKICDQMKLARTENAMCFAAKADTGEILYSFDSGMIGKNIEKYGLDHSILKDGYMNFAAFEGNRHFIVSSQVQDVLFFWMVGNKQISTSRILYSAIAFAAYSVTFLIVLLLFMNGYNSKRFRKEISVQENSDQRNGEEAALEEDDSWIAQAVRFIGWEKKTPEEKVTVVFNVCLFLMLFIGYQLLLGSKLRYGEDVSIIDFLLNGEWMRGLNALSFCSILLVSSEFYMLIVISELFLGLLSGMLSSHGETVCMLLKNLIRYVCIFAWIYLSLQYLGFPMDTIIASLGLVSLALSLGARDLAADIISGLFIMLERSFSVGDRVIINGDAGTVLEIGVRSTKLNVSGDHIKVISNHNISDIENLSRQPTFYSLKLDLMTDRPIEEIEEMLKRELAEISKKTDLLISPLKYCGISRLEGIYGDAKVGRSVLEIQAKFLEENRYEAELFVNREVRILLEREGLC